MYSRCENIRNHINRKSRNVYKEQNADIQVQMWHLKLYLIFMKRIMYKTENVTSEKCYMYISRYIIHMGEYNLQYILSGESCETYSMDR